MTIEEAIQAANNGDVGAMIGLAKHYYSENNFKEAIKWFEMSTEGRIFPYSVHMLALLTHILAISAMSIAQSEPKYFEFCLEDWRKAHKWAALDLKYVREGYSKDYSLDDVQAHYNEVSYGLALFLYFEDKAEAAELLCDATDLKAQLLHCVCAVAVKGKSNEQLAALCARIGTIMNDRNFPLDSMDKWEDEVYFAGALYAALGYRLDGTKNGMSSAVAILKKAISVVKSDDLKETLRKELSRYREKFFGGYTYA